MAKDSVRNVMSARLARMDEESLETPPALSWRRLAWVANRGLS